LSGCFGGSSDYGPPEIDASDAAAEAIAIYDSNSDGALSGGELDQVPGLKGAQQRIDQDADGRITAAEIADRIGQWQDVGLGTMSVRVTVILDGSPLQGATVHFEPEPFLGDSVQPASGETGPEGSAQIAIPPAARSAPDAPPGVHFGFYKIRISKQDGGTERVPATFNSETTLGQEVAFDDPVVKQGIRLELKSR
jgi:hypothetical protein